MENLLLFCNIFFKTRPFHAVETETDCFKQKYSEQKFCIFILQQDLYERLPAKRSSFAIKI